MAYFNHAFNKTFVGTAGFVQGGAAKPMMKRTGKKK